MKNWECLVEEMEKEDNECVVLEAGNAFDRQKEESDINQINILFDMNHIPLRAVLVSQGADATDKSGIDGYFSSTTQDGGNKDGKSGKTFDLKAKTYSPLVGKGLVEIVLAKYQDKIDRSILVAGYVYHNTNYIISKDKPGKYFIFPNESARKAVERHGVQISHDSPAPGELKSLLDSSTVLPNGVTPECGVVYRYKPGKDIICSMYVRFSELDDVEVLQTPTWEAEFERHRTQEELKAERERKQREEWARHEEEIKALRLTAKKEIQDILDADGLICPFDNTPLMWNQKKKAIRCSKKMHQNCGNPGANNAGVGGIQGSNLNKIKSGYLRNRDYESANTLDKAISSYKQLLYTLDPEIMPSTLAQLKANVERINGGPLMPNFDEHMRRMVVKATGDWNAWETYKQQHYAEELAAKPVKPTARRGRPIRESDLSAYSDLDFLFQIVEGHFL